jgi:outer membrane protein assembly factor BamB
MKMRFAAALWRQRLSALLFSAELLAGSPLTVAADWPMLGHDKTRNAVSLEKNAPIEWDIKTGRNVKWKAELGSITVSEPIVADGLIWVGTKNDPPHDTTLKSPGGVLACLRERDGAFLDQHFSTVTNHPLHRRSEFGMTGSPMAEGDRLWFVSTAAEILCLDTTLLRSGKGNSKMVWRLDMLDDLRIHPTVDIMGGKGMCSIGGAYRDFIYVITGNGVDWTRSKIPSPLAPDLVCLNKNTGKIVWEDHSSMTNILFGEFASPLVIEAGGVAQVIAPQGDGWLRSFEADTGRLLWKFDINPKAVRRRENRNFFVHSPVFHDGHVYIGGGRDVESGEGPGRLVCLDPNQRGDLSLEIEDPPGGGKPNPNSGAIWHFDEIGRTMSNVAVHDGLVVAVDFGGFVYCLDAATGRQIWRHDTKAHIWGSPLVVDNRIYIGNEDGDFFVFELAREKRLLFSAEFAGPVYSSPIFANGVLYIVAQPTLYAIRQGASGQPGRPQP